jgi:bis(5'-nucleosyl)-tetraphosphatase (symmetrical)
MPLFIGHLSFVNPPLKPSNACDICPLKKARAKSAARHKGKNTSYDKSRLPSPFFRQGFLTSMAVYAIGDVQGCLTTLQTLLERIHFDPIRDVLWFTGDLVDIGPQSLETLRFVKRLGDKAVVVLGNHDLHLLAVAGGFARSRPHNAFHSTLNAPDRKQLMEWLTARPLLYHDDALDLTLVHAGLLPQWEIADAKRLALEVENAIVNSPEIFFGHLFGDTPDHWEEDMPAPARWRVVVNAMTRLRYCDKNGHMALRHKEPPIERPPHLLPWFDVPGRRTYNSNIIFGHWPTLGLCRGDRFIALDSGCGWGGDLTAVRLDVTPLQFYTVAGPKSGFPENTAPLTFPVPNPEEATYITSRVKRIVPKRI